MAEVLYYAIPFFVLLLVLEYLSFRQVQDEHADLIGYEARDTRTSLTMGLGNVAINFVWKFAVLALYIAIYELTPLLLDPSDWWVWVLLFFGLLTLATATFFPGGSAKDLANRAEDYG